MTKYLVYITPLVSLNIYGDEIDVSDYVEINGIPSIKKTIDSEDYNFGAFKYGDINLKGINENGYFNAEDDSRSIFKFSRDMAKVRIEFSNEDGNTSIFYGLINEDATKLDATGNQISFRVLSRDSVIRDTKISSGVISSGMTCQNAMRAILNNPRITSILNYSAANINPDYNFNIDVGSYFDNKKTRDALNELLLASNSVMVINSSGDMIIKDRTEDTTKDVLFLYGPFDEYKRQNITELISYNTGRHRMFNAVSINDTVAENSAYIQQFGYKLKEVNFDFITDNDTENAIATNLMNEFKVSKAECEVKVPTRVVRDVEIFDRIAINYPLRTKPIADKFMPILGATKIGDTEMPLPQTFGSISISNIYAYKVIEIEENPDNFITKLKLRQVGIDLDDGTFLTYGNSILGYAIIGEAIIASGDTDPWNPSIIGAARIGYTEID